MSDESEKVQVDVTYLFDEILARHMERLLGSRHGIGGLQLRIGTIACLTLIADQLDREEEDGAPGEENTAQVLESRLAELGLRDKDKVQTLIREMLEKGYLLADEQGRLSGGKPAVSMARLLERVFPKLPGKTLVAYFIQTIDEVLTGRKTPEVAVAHFDQTLKMQGFPLTQLKAEKTSHVQSPVKREREKLDDLPREMQQGLKRKHEPLTTEEPRVGFRIIGSSEDGFRYTARDIKTIPPITPSKSALPPEPSQEKQPVMVEPPSPELTEDRSVSLDTPRGQIPESRDISPEAPLKQVPETFPVSEEIPEGKSGEISDAQPSEERGGHQAAFDETSFDEDKDTSLEASPAETEKEQPPAEEENDSGNVEERPLDVNEVSPETESESVAADQGSKEPEGTGDDLIEKQIAGFQNELASLCPLCKEGRVREETTGTGRVYFKCTNKSCNLVSWGRPHHISCPVCNNPFLIEMSAGQEKCHLQCPRATCKYQCTISQTDSSPGRNAANNGLADPRPRRRVVRRRVVKKKK